MKNQLHLDRLLVSAVLVSAVLVSAVFALLTAVAGPAEAGEEKPKKEYDPHITYAFPAGGQRGTTVETMIRGRGLEGASEARVSGGGVTVKILAIEEPSTELKQRSANRQDQSENPNVVRISVEVAADAELGQRDLRLITPKGVTNRFRFVVGQLAEIKEVEPNSLPGEVQALENLPVLVNGQVFQGDRDFFRFTAKAGQKIVCDLHGRKLLPYIADAVPGWLQASLTLYDDAGKELAYVDDYRFNPDPLLIYEVEKDGDYVVEIKDVLFRGREDLVYRLSIGELPCLTHVYPLGGQRGSEAQIELYGVNLPGDSIKLSLPDDSPPLRQVQVDHNGLSCHPLPFAVDDRPEAMETEPNDTVEQATKIAAPVTVNGRIQQPGDVDRYVFTVQAKQTLVLEVRARRLESPMDPIITLFDPKGRQLLENDDTLDNSYGLITHLCDCRLQYTFPAEGDYVVQVRDVQDQGGEQYAYRLRVAPPRPDFLLRIVPDNPRIRQADNGLIKVKAFRRDGFNAPIDLKLKDLPTGCVASPAVISANLQETRLTVTAAADAPLGLFSPTIEGTAQIGEESVVRQASPSEDLMQAFIYWHNVPSEDFLPSIVKSGRYALSADVPSDKPLEVAQGGKVEVVVKATRQEEAKGAIRLAADTPPRGITVRATPIAADKGQATVTITVTNQAPVGLQENIIITGTLRIGKDNVTRYAPAIPIKVIAPEKKK